MAGVNGWLVALSFALGLVLTFAFTIRRVTREVPVSRSAPSAAGDTGDSDDTAAAEPAG